MGYFNHLETLPADPILEIIWTYRKDPRPDKVDLSVGIYYDQNLQVPILHSVKEAEQALVNTETDKTYLPIDGHPVFIAETKKILFGEELFHRLGKRLYGAETPGGTGALRVGGDFLVKAGFKTIYVSDPTWNNHIGVFSKSGFKIETYPYYDAETGSVNFEKMLTFIKKIPERSAVLLHACCHNPTGCDLSEKEWEELSSVMLKRKLFPLFDVAYQGFGKGIEEDAFAVRHFASAGHEMLVAYSYSKMFGLYAERVGALFFVGEKEEEVEACVSHIKVLIRTHYSNPPKHGAAVVAYILSNPSLKQNWMHELTKMRNRIHEMRLLFSTALVDRAKFHNYRFIADTYGMFCYTGLTKSQVDLLAKEYGIYMLSSGRINVTGLSEDNILYVVDAIIKVAEG